MAVSILFGISAFFVFVFYYSLLLALKAMHFRRGLAMRCIQIAHTHRAPDKRHHQLHHLVLSLTLSLFLSKFHFYAKYLGNYQLLNVLGFHFIYLRSIPFRSRVRYIYMFSSSVFTLSRLVFFFRFWFSSLQLSCPSTELSTFYITRIYPVHTYIV